ncbi:hypothetical protein PR048_008321 [Dryococelus australis]|uniref:Uncharacterized protein n=1 Tax=Dryococelus australis TaxID=614101 RepID=A0ABQ9HWS5_9NEOP|nr:hypothetical protein PR048_008321 [Dryococelus australis]
MNAPSGSSRQDISQYAYFSRLSFLHRCVGNKKTERNISEETNEGNEGENNVPPESGVEANKIRPIKKKIQGGMSSSEERFTQILEKKV